ncbi:MAG: hypothetical protein AB7I30_14030 [Isosphaeraceae bacterium]
MMRNHEIAIQSPKRTVNWTTLLVSVLLIHSVLIGSMELLCYVLIGELSPLVAGFGLVAAVLVSIRKIGETLWGPIDLTRSSLDD